MPAGIVRAAVVLAIPPGVAPGRVDDPPETAAVLARGDDPPETAAVLARGDDPLEPPAALPRVDVTPSLR